MNPFKVGQEVVCVDGVFTPNNKIFKKIDHPKKNEILKINRVSGSYIGFLKYDNKESFNLWIHWKFAPVADITELIEATKQKQDAV